MLDFFFFVLILCFWFINENSYNFLLCNRKKERNLEGMVGLLLRFTINGASKHQKGCKRSTKVSKQNAHEDISITIKHNIMKCKIQNTGKMPVNNLYAKFLPFNTVQHFIVVVVVLQIFFSQCITCTIFYVFWSNKILTNQHLINYFNFRG